MSRPTPIVGAGNRLLMQLGTDDLSALRSDLKMFSMARGAVLHPAMGVIDHVYFPLSGMVSLLAVMKTGEQIETAIVGRQGVVGASIGSFGPYSFSQATVQIPGTAWQIRSGCFLQLFNASARFRQIINGFQFVILLQAQQSAACHAVYSVEARLCRWLLQSQDVISSDEVQLTQEFLSHMLGVQRGAVSLCAANLQQRRLIEYSRGNIKILDRGGLEKSACECYEVIREHVQRSAETSELIFH